MAVAVVATSIGAVPYSSTELLYIPRAYAHVMDLLWVVYLLSSAVLATAGLAMVAVAVRAYFVTARPALLQLSVGFAIVVAAVLSTTIVGVLDGFENPQLLFTVQYAVMTVGFVFVLYSITGQ